MSNDVNPIRVQVFQFISHFKTGGTGEVERVFTNGLCYWFATILSIRFPDSRVLYDPVANHFAAEIDGAVFDITGDVAGKYSFVPWDSYDDESHKLRIIRDCVLKIT